MPSKLPIAPKKLIEVGLPLDEINDACVYEGFPGIGAHPRGLHPWWARRPLAAARAVLFAQLVNDPGGERGWGRKRGETRAVADANRKRLFEMIRKLVLWDNIANRELLTEANSEIMRSWVDVAALNGIDPASQPIQLHDPFAGRGSIPFEGLQLGIQAVGSDLNPVAALINKATLEVPCIFRDRAPVSAVTGKAPRELVRRRWTGTEGLSADVKYYGAKMAEKLSSSLGKYYARARVSKELARKRPDLAPYVGRDLQVVNWIWARTVASPDPRLDGAHVPLVRSFLLASRSDGDFVIAPRVNRKNRSYEFEVHVAPAGKKGTEGTVGKAKGGAVCLLTDRPIPFKYIRDEGKAGRIGYRLMAVVAQGAKNKLYLPPECSPAEDAIKTDGLGPGSMALPEAALGFRIQEYGITRHRDLYTPRQRLALTTACDMVREMHAEVLADAARSFGTADALPLEEGGRGARAYADAVALYLAFAVDRCVDFNNSLCGWRPGNEKIMGSFSDNKVPMVWDFGEANFIADGVGGFPRSVDYIAECVGTLAPALADGRALQGDAAQVLQPNVVVSTDPPYYDNIGYSDLSDLFYVWLRRSLRGIWPAAVAQLLVPKDEELIASPERHGGDDAADKFFMEGMENFLAQVKARASPLFPSTLYYSFRQSDTKKGANAAAGWEAFLQAVVNSGLVITGTWPLRAEQKDRRRALGSNALASCIVLVCRPRSPDAATVIRREFLKELDAQLPEALAVMVAGVEGAASIPPTDLQQCAIGPGMAIFSRYAAVLEADGRPMTVHDAMGHIIAAVDAFFEHVEGDLDSETRFGTAWFQQYGFDAGPFGDADVLARAKGTTVDRVASAGIAESARGKVKLILIDEYPEDWDPADDDRVPVWEACHQLCRALAESEGSAGELLARMPEKQDAIRQLAYRLFTLCDRQGRSAQARRYNELIASWSAIADAANKAGHKGQQLGLV